MRHKEDFGHSAPAWVSGRAGVYILFRSDAGSLDGVLIDVVWIERSQEYYVFWGPDDTRTPMPISSLDEECWLLRMLQVPDWVNEL